MIEILCCTLPALPHVKRIEWRWGGIIVWSVLLPVAALITQDWFRKCRLECQRASCGEVEHFTSYGQPCPGNHHSQPGRALQHSADWAPQSNKVLLLEPEILPGFDKPVDCPWSSWDIAFFAAQPCMPQSSLRVRHTCQCCERLHGKLKMSLTVTVQVIPHHLKDTTPGYQLVSCHVVCGAISGDCSLHFPCGFWLLPHFLWPCFCLWHRGSPWGNIHPDLN